MKDQTFQPEVFSQLSISEQELVMFCHDHATGLRAIIAVHNTVLGPALGGLRMWNYASERDALFDVLRLARGMTYKSAAAGLNLGGGKAVIIGDSRAHKSEALLRRFGRFVNDLGGKYITAEDVGISAHDIETIRKETPHVAGLLDRSGDPSPFTAYGVWLSIRAAMKRVTGTDDLSGRSVMVQGTGNVGLQLVKLLRRDGATVYAHDLNAGSLKSAVMEGAKVVSANDVYEAPVDVYAPCALGATLNPMTIPQLRCSVVAGAANNQLLDEARDGRALQERGILYVPDFVANAGGIINISIEKSGSYCKERALKLTENIYDTVTNVFDICDREGELPQQAAMALAKNRLRQAGNPPTLEPVSLC